MPFSPSTPAQPVGRPSRVGLLRFRCDDDGGGICGVGDGEVEGLSAVVVDTRVYFMDEICVTGIRSTEDES